MKVRLSEMMQAMKRGGFADLYTGDIFCMQEGQKYHLRQGEEPVRIPVKIDRLTGKICSRNMDLEDETRYCYIPKLEMQQAWDAFVQHQRLPEETIQELEEKYQKAFPGPRDEEQWQAYMKMWMENCLALKWEIEAYNQAYRLGQVRKYCREMGWHLVEDMEIR